MKILGFYISRTDWETKNDASKVFAGYLIERLYDLKQQIAKQSETYTDKSGRLRFKHNGQFAPDNRTKFKQTHDQLRAEYTYKQAQKYNEEQPSDNCAVGNYDDIKKASEV